MSIDFHEDIQEASNILRTAERERNPGHKISGYDEGMKILDDDDTSGIEISTDLRSKSNNIQKAYLRSLIKQLPTLVNLDITTWFEYIMFLGKYKSQADEIFMEVPELKSVLNNFINLWKPDLIKFYEKEGYINKHFKSDKEGTAST